jgi:pyruvate/2-oxoglutarate dehydrogenase complex dihydrolipoamide dehydrogenase (E3) component
MVVGDASLDIDTLVIGAGPGGYAAAIRAAQLGQSVLCVDRQYLGGVCLNVGCIPSKALINAAHQFEAVQHASAFGIEAAEPTVNWPKVQDFKNGVVSKMTGGVGTLLKGNKVEFFSGEVMFINEHEARVFNEQESPRYRFKNCIIATGSRPIELKAFPFGGRILSSTEALSLSELPKSMIVIGGGYIGVELGQMYSKFGTKVTIIEGADSILPEEAEGEGRRDVHRRTGEVCRADRQGRYGYVHGRRRREIRNRGLSARHGRPSSEHGRRARTGSDRSEDDGARLRRGRRSMPHQRPAYLCNRRYRSWSSAGA